MDYVIASFRKGMSPRAWNIYPDVQSANADLDRARAREKTEECQVMTWEQWELESQAYWLNLPTQEISEETYHEMLNVLPPMKWEGGDFWESFLMSEFMSGNITSQYCRSCERYYTKYVNARDRSTWLTPATLASVVG